MVNFWQSLQTQIKKGFQIPNFIVGGDHLYEITGKILFVYHAVEIPFAYEGGLRQSSSGKKTDRWITTCAIYFWHLCTNNWLENIFIDANWRKPVWKKMFGT